MFIKHLSLTTIIVLILSSSSSFTANAHGEETHEKKIDLFMGAQSEAAKAVSLFHQALRTGDKKTARALLADDVIIFEGGGVERSADEYASHHMLSDMKYLAAIASKQLEHQVFTNDDMAYSISRSKTTGTYKGKKVDNTGMESMTLKNTDSGWKITHIHWSN
ncbi:nuclear transport factor 2 family protein [Paraglaciecola agarilytica]|uniref:YybH family protein n=1 Tax=Paraglaciecola chathamensis TaxID=368405 RepID=UPI001C09EB6E|nr:nuclear transport factor 2 family protein [Paraglaciecola agarilytica]MBU3018232.1 nuclear transport factor 2 family protein [Paraglaciecola agarilytica]